jgi:hypothetical protein
METVKDAAEIVYSPTVSIADPPDLMEYFKAKKRGLPTSTRSTTS